MSDPAAARTGAAAVFTIPAHRSFADALAAGLLRRHGQDPLGLARGRILLPNNRAVRAVTDAFVRCSGAGLVLPRLIPIGDPDLDERIGGALDPADTAEPIPPAASPLERLVALAELLRRDSGTSAEALRTAAELGRTLDALAVEEIEPARLSEAACDVPDLAVHWQESLERLRRVLKHWPEHLAAHGLIDLADRRNRLLRGIAERWRRSPPEGFTVAAGITTAAPAVAALLRTVAFMPGGSVVLPALNLRGILPDAEWESLGPGEQGGGEETHPQFHLKLLLDRMGVAREEVQMWRAAGSFASPAYRSRAVANAMTAAEFSGKWSGLRPVERRLSGVRVAELPDAAAEAQAIALALRESLETPGRTAALVTPDRELAARVSGLLRRWGIAADDSAGRALSQLPAGTLLLGLVKAAAEQLAPVALLALLKHPSVGGKDDDRRSWLDSVRLLDLALRGPRPAPGLAGMDAHFRVADKEVRGCGAAWTRVRPLVEPLEALLGEPVGLPGLARKLADAAQAMAGDAAWSGPDGRLAAQLLAELQSIGDSRALQIEGDEAEQAFRQLLDAQRVRPPYGGHPRLHIWGLLEARLQHADFMVLGGLNEGSWPASPSPDPWLAPKIRANLAMPGLDYRVGLSAHDFASALGAPQVLVTRARRDSRSPTVASRLWLRLLAMTGGLPHDVRLERLAVSLDDPGEASPADRPAPCPPRDQRPVRISVTAVDRLNADPFAFYAQAVLRLRKLDPVDADHSAAWRGTSVHAILEQWLKEDGCDPDLLQRRAETLLAHETIHPMLRALWQPRLIEGIRWMADRERSNRASGRRPLAAEIRGEARIGEVVLHGKADRIDRLPDGSLAIVDYKTGKPPAPKAVLEGFALQLGLLGLIAEHGGFDGIAGRPAAHEYWSLSKKRDQFGYCLAPDSDIGADAFLDHARRHFQSAADKWLTGEGPFTAKLNPAYAPWGDYDQLMRLEEWYGRR